jgi:hypothetical protein
MWIRVKMQIMKTASIRLALIVVLGFASEAGAQNINYTVGKPHWDASAKEISYTVVKAVYPTHDYRFWLGDQAFGFAQWPNPGGSYPYNSCCFVGPLGECEVPFTATQGLVGFCVIVVGMVALATTLSVRWKRKQSS